MSSPTYSEYPTFWYNVNFTDDLIFKGETTRFLRIHFPDIIDDGQTYYVTVMPVLQTHDEQSAFSINGINARDLYDHIQSSIQTYECMNVYGTKQYTDPNEYDNFLAPANKFWQEVKPGGQYAYRIDYDTCKEEIIKLIVLISAYKPTGSNFIYSGFTPPLGFSIFPKLADVASSTSSPLIMPHSFIDYPDIENGVKGVNEHLVNEWKNTFHKTNEDIYDNVFKMDFREVDIVGYPCKKKEGRSNINEFPTNEKLLHDDKTSSMLMRTNPILSGNIKITVDSNEDIWLNSIDANEQLSDSRFKKFKLSPNSSYAVDLYTFLDEGKVPSEVLFDLKEYDDQYEHTKKEYYLQYDNYYGYGVSQLNSKLYDEAFKFFAPLWLKDNLPEFFVILRVDHSVNLSSYQDLTNKDIADEIFEKSKIVKTFDMRDGSKIGTYLRNIVQHPSFTTKPLYVSFDKDTQSTWTGISYKDGIVSSKGEFLYSVFEKDRTIKEMDEYLTEGFKRNSIICQNLINMEFLFDDDEVEDYTINRYIGFYVNEIELSKFSVDKLALSKNNEQKPVARYGIDMQEYSTLTFNQTNDNGIKIPVRINDRKLPLPEHFEHNKIIAVKNREDKFSRIKYAINDSLTYHDEKFYFREFSLYDTKYNMGLLTGIENMSYQTEAILATDGPSQCVFSLYDTLNDTYIFNPGEELVITWARNGSFHQWKMIANETGLQRGDWWDFPVYNIDDFTYTNTFNPRGTPEQVANAIAGCINQFSNREFDAVAIENKVYIRSQKEYEGANSFSFTRFFNGEEISDNLRFYDLPVSYDGFGTPEMFMSSSNFVGGSSSKNNRAIVDFTAASNVEENDWFQTQSGKYSQVKSHNVNNNSIIALPYLDEPIYEDNKIVGFNDIDTYKVLELTDDNMSFYTGKDKRIIAFKIFEPSFSLLSFLPVKDFDFDFFSSDYAYTPTAELLRFFEEFTVSSGESLEIELNEFYKISEASGSGPIYLQGYKDGEWETIGTEYTYKILETTSSEIIDFETLLPFSSPQLLDDTDTLKLFNTYTPNVFHKLLEPSETSSKYFRRYIYTNKYEKMRIVNDSTADLKFSKFLYMKKNTMIANVPGSPGCEVTVIGEEHLDLDVQNFKGFAGLRDILTIADEAILNNLIEAEDFTRFFFGMLFTEYDRLRENYLKEWATKSMVVPYINKWVSDGTDVRDNKYRFNLSSAFGITNFSPSFDVTRDSSVYTHEWFYLDEHPRAYPEELTKNSRGYMFQSLNDVPGFENNTKTWRELLYDVNVDYFTKYFSLGYPHETYNNNAVLKPRSERFVFSSFIEGINETYSLFHGIKMRIDELDEFGEVVKNSTKYDDYKFAAILTRRNKRTFNSNKLYDIEIIDNQRFKSITFILTVFLHDHKLFDDLSYTSLYTSKSAYKTDTVQKYISTTCDEYDWISFWNIKFDMAKRMDNHRFAVIADYQDIQTQSSIDIDSTTTNYARNIIGSIRDLYSVDFDEFRKINAGSLQTAFDTYEHFNLPYSKIISFEGFANKYYSLYNPLSLEYDISGGSIVHHTQTVTSGYGEPANPTNMYMYDLRLGENMYYINDVKIKNDSPFVTEVIDFYNLYYDNTLESNYVYALSTNLSWINSSLFDDSQFFYLNGGENYNEKILEKISFKEIASLINNNDRNHVSYISIYDDGTTSTDMFNLEFIDFTKFTKNDVIKPIKDTEKPQKFKTTDIIGYDIKTNDDTEVVYRYGGYFEPKTRNLIDFWVNEFDTFAEYYETDFILCNTSIGTNISSNGVIKNHSYNKVNETEILKIANETSFKSKYPLVNEIAIANKDLFVMKSNWDKSYYVNHNAVNKMTYIDGMNEIVESKAFMGSKVMNVPNLYEFYEFNENEYSVEIKNFIKPNVKPLENIGNKDAIGPNTPRIEISFDLENRIIREILENNGTRELDWISNNIPGTLVSSMTQAEKENYIRKYVEKNILELYNFTDVIVYSKKEIENQTDVQNTLPSSSIKEIISISSYIEISRIIKQQSAENVKEIILSTSATNVKKYMKNLSASEVERIFNVLPVDEAQRLRAIVPNSSIANVLKDLPSYEVKKIFETLHPGDVKKSVKTLDAQDVKGIVSSVPTKNAESIMSKIPVNDVIGLVDNISQVNKTKLLSTIPSVKTPPVNQTIQNALLLSAIPNITIETIPVSFDMTKTELLVNGYTEYKNVEVERLGELSLKLTIFTDTTSYMDYAVGINVKRI